MQRDLAVKILTLAKAVKDALADLMSTMFIIYQPKDCVITAVGDTVVFTLSAMNVHGYQWQRTDDNGTTWNNSTGAGNKTDSLSFTASNTNKNWSWRCVLTDADNNVIYSELCKIVIE